MNRVLVIALLLPLAVAARARPAAAAEGTTSVTRGDLVVTVTADGTFEAAIRGVAIPAPRVWSSRYVVREAAEPGSLVAAGEVVLRFDDRALRDRVEDSGFDLDVARGDLEALLVRHRIAREAGEREAEEKARAIEKAEKRLHAFLEHEKPQAAERRRLDHESELQSLNNSREELSQLILMYEEDELVDDTEKIVMARARWNVAYREALHELGKRARVHKVEFDEKEREESLYRAVEKARRAIGRHGAESELAERDRGIAVERARRALARRQRDLEGLVADLEGMTVRAPASGILVHGPAEGGLARRFVPGDAPTPVRPVVTILDPKALLARLRVDAKEALRLKAGARVTLTPGAIGSDPLVGVVEEVAPLPKDGKIRVRCRPEADVPALLLGGALEGGIVVHEVKDALLLPLKAIRRKGERAFVVTVPAGGPPLEVDVRLGADDGKSVVVLEGLAEGAEVHLP